MLKEYKGILTKEFLLKEYVDNKKSSCTIAKEIECCDRTVLNWLNKHNIVIRTGSESNKLRSKMNLILTKEYLIENYVVKKLSLDKIANLLDCSSSKIFKKMVEYDIPRRSRLSSRLRKDLDPILTKDYLIENYVNLKLSLNEIANKFNCSDSKILNKMKEYNLPRRNYLEAGLKWAGEKHPKYNSELHKIHFCIEPDCNNKIGYRTWLSGGKRCSSCATKEVFKIPENCTGHIDGRTLKTYYCIDCSNEISYNTWKDGGGRCQSCSTVESNKSPEVRRKMSLAHGGTGVPYENAKYPAEFDEIFKNDIRMRDGYICQGKDCGITEKEHKIKFNQVLHCHHIDHNRQNCSEKNLITLCAICNIGANKNQKYWELYYIILLHKNLRKKLKAKHLNEKT